MEATALLHKGIVETGNQIQRTLLGLTQDAVDFRPHDSAMSVGEHITHLTESYIAVQAESRGETHDWGSYQSPLNDLSGLLAEMWTQRDLAIASLNETDEALTNGLFFFALHDGYHIGQLCLLRQAMDPTWSSFTIYGEGA
jgi:hypothetical protein